MKRCQRCNSAAINPHIHGRNEGVDLDLCDVCYWRKRAEVVGDTLIRHALVVAAAGYTTAIAAKTDPTVEQEYLAYLIGLYVPDDQISRSVDYVNDSLNRFRANDDEWSRAFRKVAGVE